MAKSPMNILPSSKLPLVSWCVYGWASDTFPVLITTFIFSTYFIDHIAVDKITGTYQWANATALAGIIIAIIGPIFGAIADQGGQHKRWLAFFTFSCIVSTGLLWFAYPSITRLEFALVLFIIGTISLEIALIFYNSFLPRLAPKGFLGRTSGWGWGLGYLGGIVALTVLLFVSVIDKPTWLDAATFEQIRIVGPFSAVWFAVFCLPFFFFVPDTPKIDLPLNRLISHGLKELLKTLRHLAHGEKNILLFLFARMIYTDGLNTLFAFGGIYAVGTFQFTFIDILIFGITLNVLAGIGAISLAHLDDYLGSKTTIVISLVFLIFASFGLLLAQNRFWFWLTAGLISLFVGPVQSASRSLMARLTPLDKSSELFGLFALSGRITAFIGPWVLGYSTLYFHTQRAGLATVLIFFIIGLICLSPVRIAKLK